MQFVFGTIDLIRACFSGSIRLDIVRDTFENIIAIASTGVVLTIHILQVSSTKDTPL